MIKVCLTLAYVTEVKRGRGGREGGGGGTGGQENRRAEELGRGGARVRTEK